MQIPWSSFKQAVILREASIQYVELETNYWLKMFDGVFELECIIPLDPTFADTIDFETNFKANGNKKLSLSSEVLKQPDPAPFAQPLYRTKRMKTSAIETVAPGSEVEILFKLTSELWTHGGAMVVKNAEIGDYIYAEVEDIDGVIPAPYRAATCEAWPVVASYIIGEWVELQGQYSIHRIDTSPLVAKISSGLYLSFHYIATSAGASREVGINYYMNKKL